MVVLNILPKETRRPGRGDVILGSQCAVVGIHVQGTAHPPTQVASTVSEVC